MAAVPERVSLLWGGLRVEYGLIAVAPEPPATADPDRVGPVVPYSQRDSPWAALMMGGTTQRVSGYGCAMIDASMVLSQVRPDVTPAEFLARLNEQKGFNILDGEAHLAWDRLPEIWPELRWLGRGDYGRRVTEPEMAALAEALADGPVPVWVDAKPNTKGMQSHFVLGLYLTKDNDLAIVDPWDGVQTLLLRRYALAGQDLQTAIWGYRWLSVRRDK